MIKPSDINTESRDDDDINLLRLEAQFDEAITLAAKAGKWPARVTHARDAATKGDIVKTADLFRQAGWRVEVGGEFRALIFPPST